MLKTFLASLLLLAMGSTGAWAQTLESPTFNSSFWSVWGDGKAELAGYELTYPRYRELRKGTAITIFVTETFSNEARVKADHGVHHQSDEVPVLKLNFVQDFQTGIYDYNLMTSTFVALKPTSGRLAGLPMKVSFSSQEWCGQVYHQLLFDQNKIRSVSHSYFDREADQQSNLPYPPNGISEDVLFHWARGLAMPVVQPGQSVKVPLFRSLTHVRLSHKPLQWTTATFERQAPEKSQTITVPAGTFEVDLCTVAIENGPTWTFFIEKASSKRIIRWQTSEGQKANLLKSSRLAYWKLNANRFEKELAKLGLKKEN